jgi:polar amino acid transport system permease protein
MTFDIARILGYVPALLDGAKYTVLVSLVAIALASALGLALALLGRSRFRVARWFVRAYVEAFRAVPELVQIYVWYYLLAQYGLVLDPLVAGVIALGVAFSPFISEVFRAGIETVDPSQWEAAQVLGMGRLVMWSRVLLPQAFRIIMPLWIGYFISMFKDTSLLSFIAVPELFESAQQIGAQNFRYFELFALVLVMYVAMVYPMAAALHWLERSWKIA